MSTKYLVGENFSLKEISEKVEELAREHSKILDSNDTIYNFNSGAFVGEDNKQLLSIVHQLNNDVPIPEVKVQRALEEFVANRKKVCEKFDKTNNVLFQAVYDLVIFIIKNTNTQDRLVYFHTLMNIYFENINKSYDFIAKLQQLVKICVPLAKLDHMANICKSEGKIAIVKPLLIELYEYFDKPLLLKEDCYEIVRKYLGTTNYHLLKYNVLEIGERKGYVADYFKAELVFQQNGHQEVLHVFVKCIPKTGSYFESTASYCFKKEDFFYNIFIPKLMEHGLGDITSFVPKCFFSRRNDMIVLEDLAATGCSMSDLRIPLDLNSVLIVIKQLAKLHACSILLEEIQSKRSRKTYRIDDEYAEMLQETVSSPTLQTGAWYVCGARHVHEYFIEQFPEIPKELSMDDFKRKAKLCVDKMFKDIEKSTTYRNVISHADLWSNNILFKKDKSGRSISAFIVDYQMPRYCPPTIDLLFFLYCTTRKNFRDSNITDLVKQYYIELSNILTMFNVDIKNMYSEEDISNSCAQIRSTAILQSLCHLQFVLCPKELTTSLDTEDKVKHFVEVNRTHIFNEALKQDEIYKERIMELVQDLYDVCEKMN